MSLPDLCANNCGRTVYTLNGGEVGSGIVCPECGKAFCDSCYDTSIGDGCHCHAKDKFRLTKEQRKLLDTIEPNDIVDYFGIGNLLDGIPDMSLMATLQERGYFVTDAEKPDLSDVAEDNLIIELQNRGFNICEKGRPY